MHKGLGPRRLSRKRRSWIGRGGKEVEGAAPVVVSEREVMGGNSQYLETGILHHYQDRHWAEVVREEEF